MFLTDDEKRMLDGGQGKVKQASMEYIVNYAEALGAERLCKVTKAQLFCGNHIYLDAIQEDSVEKLIAIMHFATEEPLEFDNDTACFSQFCSLRMDLHQWQAIGFTSHEARRNQAFLDIYRKAGIHMVGICASYLTGFLPIKGEHYVCTESHAIIYINSLWGGCCNADGIAAAFCSAMCGRTAYWGNHVPKQRKANMLVHVECPVETLYDWDSLGFALGKQCPANTIPALWVKNRETLDTDRLRSAFASMATTGGVELCHILGVTPEANDLAMAFGDRKAAREICITEKDISQVREFLCDAYRGDVDYIHLGCPHYSLEQIAAVARFLHGRKIKESVTLHIWTAPAIKFLADENGFTRIIHEAGGQLLTGSCALVSGKLPAGVRTIAFDAAKQANPQQSHFKGTVLYGSLHKCLNAAVTGKWGV